MVVNGANYAIHFAVGFTLIVSLLNCGNSFAQQQPVPISDAVGNGKHFRVIEEWYQNRKMLSSPLWPENPHEDKTDEYDRKYLSLMRSQNADSVTYRTWEITDSLLTNETINQRHVVASIDRLQTSDSLLIVSAVTCKVEELFISRYFISVNPSAQFSFDTCTISIGTPWDHPTVMGISPPGNDSAKQLLAMHIPLLVLEGFISRAHHQNADSICIPTKIASMLVQYYGRPPVIHEAWLFPPRIDLDGNVVFRCRILASVSEGLCSEYIPLVGDITINQDTGDIIHLRFDAETVLSPLDNAIPLEGVGRISISTHSK